MTKQTRREFLCSIATTAIAAAAGFVMTAVHIEEAERRYAEMLSREQDRLTEQEKYDALVDRLTQWLTDSIVIEECDNVPISVRFNDEASNWIADVSRDGWIWGWGEKNTLILSTDGGENYEEYQPTGCIHHHYKLNDDGVFVWRDRPTYEPTELTVELDIDGWMYSDGTS